MKSFVQTTRFSDASPCGDGDVSDENPPNWTTSAMQEEGHSSTPLVEKLYRGMTSLIRLLPDFLIIGAQRGGTTSLYQYLQAHPSIGPASTKEVHFFDRRFHRGPLWYRGHFPTGIERSLARHLSGRTFLTGEATPCYLFYPHAPGRVACMLPHVKLIVLLRNPVDRAYSQHFHAVDHGFATESFEAAIECEQERAPSERVKILNDGSYYSLDYMERSYLARGRYAEQLRSWLELFPREQFLILKSEEFYADPATTIRRVLTFLNVPKAEQRVGALGYRRYNTYRYASMNPDLRNRLIEYFGPHNAHLYDLLGRDFGWKS